MNYMRNVAAGGIFSLLLCCTIVQAGDLKVEVSGIKEHKGDVIITIFNGKTQWLKKMFVRQKTVAKLDKVDLIFENLLEGEYAISAIHDINSNGDLDKNFMGMPSEPYGFSNNAEGNFGPPTFEQTKIVVDSDKKFTSIRLK